MPPTHDPRRARTRAALLEAAQALLIQDRANVSVLEITQLAGVGQGSFYNHFESKDDLFAAAVDDVLEQHGVLMDRVAEGVDDPAETFARAFRLTGRLHRLLPGASKVILGHGLALVTADRGLAPRARRDIEAAVAAGRFAIADPELGLVIVAGSALALGQLLHTQPDRDAAAATDQLTADLLRLFGLSEDEAADLATRSLPDLDELMHGAAASA